MIRVVSPGPRTGSLKMPASKSAAHRLLILAALSDRPSGVLCETVPKDVAATAECLEALGARLRYTSDKVFLVTPLRRPRRAPKPVRAEDYALDRPEAFAESLAEAAEDLLSLAVPERKDGSPEAPADDPAEASETDAQADAGPAETVSVSFGPEDAMRSGKLKTAADWLNLPDKAGKPEEKPPAPPAGARHLYCGESGTTLRFMLPLAAALGIPAVFHMEGRLSERPIGPLADALEAHGAAVRKAGNLLYLEGQLQPGDYTVPGNVSSQFVSGLLLALPLLAGDSRLTVTEKLESEAYVTMTEEALKEARVAFAKNGPVYRIPGDQRFLPPDELRVESDWSSAAVFFAMGALSEGGVTAGGMNLSSCHADRKVLTYLEAFGADVSEKAGTVTVRKGALRGVTIDASQTPDLVPALCALACAAEGETRVVNAGRLRLKESDRIRSTVSMLRALGADVEEEDEGLVIRGTGALRGGTVDPQNDHRIVMAAAVAAGCCTDTVRILDAECVEKSYPAFFRDLNLLRKEN